MINIRRVVKRLCKECVKVSKDRELSNNSSYQNVKRTLDIKHIECTTCNKIISKTNWSKHEKTQIHNERHSN
jgi:hypothetical protein